MTEKIKSDSNLNLSMPQNLKNLINYAAGSIVSRIIAKSKSGSMTIFSFDVGQELGEHSAPYDAFVQIIDGKALLTINGREIETSSGELVLMPANMPHAVRAAERFIPLEIRILEIAIHPGKRVHVPVVVHVGEDQHVGPALLGRPARPGDA